MKKKVILLISIVFCTLIPLFYFYLSGSFYYHNVKSFFKIDLLNYDEYYHPIKGEYDVHEINLSSFSLKTPKSFRYIELDGEDAFVGYIANKDISIYFYFGTIMNSNVPITSEESFERYGQRRKNELYDIQIDSVDSKYGNIIKKLAKGKKQPIDMWLLLTIRPKNCNKYELYLTMHTNEIDKNNEVIISNILKSIKINDADMCPPTP